jgi:hypothetical protein
MEVHKPHNTKNITLIGTCAIPKDRLDWKTGMLTVVVVGKNIANNMKIIAKEETNIIIILLDTFEPITPPTKRPHSINSQ